MSGSTSSSSDDKKADLRVSARKTNSSTLAEKKLENLGIVLLSSLIISITLMFDGTAA